MASAPRVRRGISNVDLVFAFLGFFAFASFSRSFPVQRDPFRTSWIFLLVVVVFLLSSSPLIPLSSMPSGGFLVHVLHAVVTFCLFISFIPYWGLCASFDFCPEKRKNKKGRRGRW